MDSTLEVSRLLATVPDPNDGLPTSGHLVAGSVSAQAGEGITVPSLESATPPGGHRTIHYRSLSDALLVTLIFSVPVLLWEEMWHGQPMIDQPGHLWLVPTVITVAAFFIGGMTAGRHRRQRTGAIVQAIALAIPVSLLLIVADVGRRLDLHRGFTLPVAALWLYALVGTAVISSLGALYGRRRYVRKRAKWKKKRNLANWRDGR
jgi:O-antigen/teichoic acid export membrane protein